MDELRRFVASAVAGDSKTGYDIWVRLGEIEESGTAKEFLEWLDTNRDAIMGSYPAKSEALNAAEAILLRLVPR